MGIGEPLSTFQSTSTCKWLSEPRASTTLGANKECRFRGIESQVRSAWLKNKESLDTVNENGIMHGDLIEHEIRMVVLSYSLARLLIRPHHSLVCLLRTACAFCCAHLIARTAYSLPCSWESVNLGVPISDRSQPYCYVPTRHNSMPTDSASQHVNRLCTTCKQIWLHSTSIESAS